MADFGQVIPVIHLKDFVQLLSLCKDVQLWDIRFGDQIAVDMRKILIARLLNAGLGLHAFLL